MRPRKKGTVLLALGVVLLSMGLVWAGLDMGMILLSSAVNGSVDEDGIGGGDTTIMEGTMGMMGLVAGGDDSLTNMSIDDFDMVWTPITLKGDGIYDADGGELDLGFGDEDTGNADSEEEETQLFPLFGVEKRDYSSTDSNGRVTRAEYMGESKIRGNKVYVYRVQDHESSIEDGMETAFRTNTIHYLHPSTSIPLDIQIQMEFSMVFPDFTMLWAGDTSVHRFKTTTSVKDENVPGLYNTVEVDAEITIFSEIIDNTTLARFLETTVYYDSETGEPLPDDEQPPEDRYVVDRKTFIYATGEEGTVRSGYYQFPVGALEQRPYPMWDAGAKSEELAVFKEETRIYGSRVWLYEINVENATIEGGNPILPIANQPGTQYTYTAKTSYYLDPETAMMLMFSISGVVYIVPTFGNQPGQPVAFFDTTTNESFHDMMSGVVQLFKEILIPFSGMELTAFQLDMRFSRDFSDMMMEVSALVESTMNILRLWVPMGLVLSGGLFALLGKRRRRKWKAEKKTENVPVIQVLGLSVPDVDGSQGAIISPHDKPGQ